jgi:hypothetical protein
MYKKSEARTGILKTALWMGFGLLLGLYLYTVGCGKKAPPYIAERGGELKVESLQIRRANGTLTINGHLGGSEKEPGERLTVRLYHARYDPDDSPCEGCPIRFRSFREAKVLREEESFTWRVPDVEEAGIHFFMVRLVGGRGRLSPPSNRVKLQIE